MKVSPMPNNLMMPVFLMIPIMAVMFGHPVFLSGMVANPHMVMLNGVIRGKIDLIKQHAHGFNMSTRDSHNRTLLHTAALSKNKNNNEILVQLIRLGVPLDEQETDGNTALHHAVRQLNPTIVAQLVAHGARLDISNYAGLTPIDMLNHMVNDEPASEQEMQELLSYLSTDSFLSDGSESPGGESGSSEIDDVGGSSQELKNDDNKKQNRLKRVQNSLARVVDPVVHKLKSWLPKRRAKIAVIRLFLLNPDIARDVTRLSAVTATIVCDGQRIIATVPGTVANPAVVPVTLRSMTLEHGQEVINAVSQKGKEAVTEVVVDVATDVINKTLLPLGQADGSSNATLQAVNATHNGYIWGLFIGLWALIYRFWCEYTLAYLRFYLFGHRQGGTE